MGQGSRVGAVISALVVASVAAWPSVAKAQAGGENRDLACRDGVDNDGDGLVDCADPECGTLVYCPEAGAAAPENGAAACRDGVDNDLDGLTDCADPECRVLVFCTGAPVAAPPPPPPPPPPQQQPVPPTAVVAPPQPAPSPPVAVVEPPPPPPIGVAATAQLEISPSIRRAVAAAMWIDIVAYACLLVGGAIMADADLFGAGAITIGVGALIGSIAAIVGPAAMSAWQGVYTRAGYRVRRGPIATSWLLSVLVIGTAAGAMASPFLIGAILGVVSLVTEALNFWLVRPWWERAILESTPPGAASVVDWDLIGSRGRLGEAVL